MTEPQLRAVSSRGAVETSASLNLTRLGTALNACHVPPVHFRCTVGTRPSVRRVGDFWFGYTINHLIREGFKTPVTPLQKAAGVYILPQN